MKKFIFLVFALLLTYGVANAANMPMAIDPKNYPEVWTMQVYNGSGSTIVSGYIVQWDFDTSDSTEAQNDDRCPWVKLADAASDIWTAGVLPYGQNIANGDTGAMICYGPAYVLNGTTNPTVDQFCGAATDGTVTTPSASANTTDLGRVIKATQATTTGIDDGASTWSVILVEPTIDAE
jgi:hypothetical protein